MAGNYPAGVTDNDPHFLDESEPEDKKEDYCPMCNELAFVEGHCCACDYDSEARDSLIAEGDDPEFMWPI